jgi:hypothetical protein
LRNIAKYAASVTRLSCGNPGRRRCNTNEPRDGCATCLKRRSPRGGRAPTTHHGAPRGSDAAGGAGRAAGRARGFPLFGVGTVAPPAHTLDGHRDGPGLGAGRGDRGWTPVTTPCARSRDCWASPARGAYLARVGAPPGRATPPSPVGDRHELVPPAWRPAVYATRRWSRARWTAMPTWCACPNSCFGRCAAATYSPARRSAGPIRVLGYSTDAAGRQCIMTPPGEQLPRANTTVGIFDTMR